MKKLHFYNVSYFGDHVKGAYNCVGNAYLGRSEKIITKKDIEEAKIDAKMSKEAVLLSVCYLGHMEKEKFVSGE
ncbi:MAG: hypothetical protein HRU26_07030 [Psychroserpens sp.]|nr:hypothetical protein [Psychroserpens sp.]